MRIEGKKIAAVLLTAIFSYFGVIFWGTLSCKANTPSAVTVELTQSTCVEFAQFSAYADTHRTRIAVEASERSWGSYSVNYSSPEWLDSFTVNGRTVAEYKSEYDAAPFELNSSDLYISTYGGAPISVTFHYDGTLAANVVDISIPEAFIPAEEMQSVGIAGGMTYVYEADEPCAYTFAGSFEAERSETPPKTYLVTVGEETFEVTEGARLTAPASPTKAETEEYVYEFVGWYYAEENGKRYWNFEEDAVTRDLVLLADFRAVQKVKYTVVFDPDNGDSPTSVTVLAGECVEESELPADPPKKQTEEGAFVFVEWFNADLGIAFERNTPVSSELTFVARYRSIDTFTVTVDGVERTVPEGERLTKPSYTPTKEETESHTYEFVGWYYNKEGKEVYWDFDTDTVTFDVFLQAGFKGIEKPKYTVTFDGDNGFAPTVIEVYEGACIKREQIPATPQKLSEDNFVYTFHSWSADGEIAWDFDRDRVTASVCLKAYYTMKTVYSVSFDGATQYYEKGEYLTKPVDPSKPTTAETTYAFAGWYHLVDEELRLWNFAQDTVQSDLALVSRFTESRTRYTVTFYSEGELYGSLRLAWGEVISYPTVENRAWYEHVGWVDGEGESSVSVMPTRDIIAYANWGLVEYTATLTLDYAVLYKVTYTLKTVDEARDSLNDYLTQASDEKYAYAWTTDEPIELIASDCAFAVTATKQSYKLTVLYEDGDTKYEEECVLAWDEEIVLDVPAPQRGKRFLGWKTEVGEDAPLLMPTHNLTVHAEWAWIEYTMTVLDGDGQERSFSYTAREADDEVYVKALFDGFLIPDNARAYTHAWKTPVPARLPLESGKVYEVIKTPLSYTITFENAEGVPPLTFTVETLYALQLPAPPERTGYAARWNKRVEDIGLEDTVVTAIYEFIGYKVTFAGLEEVVYFTEETLSSVRFPDVPERTGYTAAWDITPEELTLSDVTVRAVYVPIEYTLSFAGVDVDPLVYTVETKDALRLPELPCKAGYVGKWDKDVADLGLKNETFTAVYIPVVYTITFDQEGVDAIRFTVETMADILFPEVPQRKGYVGKWDKTLADVCLSDMRVKAVYEKLPESETSSSTPTVGGRTGCLSIVSPYGIFPVFAAVVAAVLNKRKEG